MMISNKIEHPLRTIFIRYDELKPFQPFEEEMLQRYTMLHNFVKELFNDYDNIQQRYEAHSRNIDDTRLEFESLYTELNRLEVNARQSIKIMLPERKQAQQMLQDADVLNKALKRFQEHIEDLGKQSDAIYTGFNRLDAKDEQLNDLFKEYKEFRGELFNSKENNYSIDPVQYDCDEQKFCESLREMLHRQDEFVRVCNQVIDKYNLLIDEVEKTYKQWADYNKMMKMIEMTMKAPIGISQICLN